MKVDFLLIGSMKSGTSAVSKFLEGHPAVHIPPRFEANFFSRDDVYDKGVDWYHSNFDARLIATARVIGEGSNSYTFGRLYPEAAARIHAYNPEMRLVYFVRHPLERMSAAWVQNVADFAPNTPRSFVEAVRSQPDRYVDPSCYYRNISRYLEFFPREQIFLGFLEDWANDPARVQAELCEFLGVPVLPHVVEDRVNPTSGKRVPSDAYFRLRSFPPLKLLSRLLSRDARRRVREKLLFSRVEAHPALPPDLRQELLSEVGPDARRFLDLAGKPEDFWRLDG